MVGTILNSVHRIGRFAVGSRLEQLLVLLAAPLFIHFTALLFTLVGRLGLKRARVRLEILWSSTVLRILGVRTTIEGTELLPQGPAILLPLHEGFLDVVLLLGLRRSIRFLARDELFEWPQLGRVLSSGGHVLIPTDPKLADYRRVVTEIGTTLAAGHDVVIFPQGSILGVEVEFATGARRLAASFGVPIVPIVITGTHRIWEHPYSPTLRRGQNARLEILSSLSHRISAEDWRTTEREMKRIALTQEAAPVRRLVPDRDGYWDGYNYSIDPDFGDLADQVAQHRSNANSRPETIGIVSTDDEGLS